MSAVARTLSRSLDVTHRRTWGRDPDVLAPAAVAGAITLVSVSLVAGIGRGAMASAVTALVVAAVLGHGQFGAQVARVLGGRAVVPVWAAILVTVGAVYLDADSPLVAHLSPLVLCWTAAIMAVTFARSRSQDRVADVGALVGVAALAVTVVIGAVGWAVVSDTGARTAIVVAVAAPVAVTGYVVDASRARRGADWLGRVGMATVVGVVAGVLALVGTGDGSSSSGQLIVVGAATLAVLAVLGLLAVGVPMPRWVPLVALALVVVVAGAGNGPLPLVGLAALVALQTSDRRDLPPRPVAEPTTTTARRAIAALTVVALGLRLVAPRGLWLDEATSVHQARLGFGEMLGLIYREDNHPPLHHALLWLDIRLVGDSELAVRLPSIVMGALLVPMLYLTGKALFDRRVGVIAAAIGAVAPLAVWYGQEARMYSQFMLLAVIAVYAQARVLQGGGARYWVLFTLSSVALIYTQYFAVLHVAATMLVFLVEIVRRRRAGNAGALLRRVLGSALAQALLLAPLVPFALYQAAHNQASGFGFSGSGLSAGSAVVPPPSIYGLLTNVQWAMFGYQSDRLTTRLVALWPIGLLLLLLLLGRRRRVASRSLVLIGALPVAAVFAASLFAAKSRSLAEVRYFAGAVPVLFLLLAAGLTTVVVSRRAQYVAAGALLASMLVTLGLQGASRENPRRYEYREAIEAIRADSRPDDVVAYAPDYLDYVVEYYDPGLGSQPLDEGIPDTPGRVFLFQAASFADSAAAQTDVALAIQELEARGMTVEERYDYAQATVWRLG